MVLGKVKGREQLDTHHKRHSTSATAWHALLQQTEMLAKARYQLVDDLTASIIEPARATLARKEDAKKKVRYPLLNDSKR
jgi:alpha-D-ribose 1-methylphosphonate 5-triphosphate synthase subunit PhnG